MQNIVVNVCEKFHNDRLRNDISLEKGKSDNNEKKNVRSTLTPVSGSNKVFSYVTVSQRLQQQLH